MDDQIERIAAQDIKIMKEKLKHFIRSLPAPLERAVLSGYIFYHTKESRKKLSSEHITIPDFRHIRNKKIKVLFYHASGLSFGGTEKMLQILAKHIDKEKFDVYFMYSGFPARKPYLENSSVTFIPFKYDTMDPSYPHYVRGMRPHILDTVKKHAIDIIVTATPGYNSFPINIIKDPPIVIVNIFGNAHTQKNVLNNISISKEVDSKIKKIIPEKRRSVMYIPSERPMEIESDTLRKQYGIGEKDMVFGRIGRADDDIFDPIGIRAFQKTVKEFTDAHYMIMSPAPKLVAIVKAEQIPNVHFLNPSSSEKDIWSFHHSIDVLAHFRADGESCGLNIIESLLCGNPVITHRSRIWNAHLEYLDSSFSRVAEIDNTEQYAEYMREMILLKKQNKLQPMRGAAKAKADRLFLIENNISIFEKIIIEAVSSKT